MKLSEKLKAQRKKLGLTQDAAAQSIGINRPRLGSYEEGRAEPNLTTLARICEVYGIDDIKSFITEEVTPVSGFNPTIDGINCKYLRLKGVNKQVVDILLGVY